MEKEFTGLDFHSVRQEKRFVKTMKTPIRQPGASIREESGDRAGPPGQSPQQSTDAGECKF
jgi:hypothetical protein